MPGPRQPPYQQVQLSIVQAPLPIYVYEIHEIQIIHMLWVFDGKHTVSLSLESSRNSSPPADNMSALFGGTMTNAATGVLY